MLDARSLGADGMTTSYDPALLATDGAHPALAALDDVAQSALPPLLSRAVEGTRSDCVFIDPYATAALRRLGLSLKTTDARPHRYFAVRAAWCDRLLRDFIRRHPGGVVVSLGDGLDTQFWRLGAPDIDWFCVDTAEIIAVRRQVLPPGERPTLIAGSILGQGWWHQIPWDRPVFIVMAGVLPYVPRATVFDLLRRIRTKTDQAEIGFDAFPWLLTRYIALKARLTPGARPAPQRFTLSQARAGRMLARHTGLELISATPWNSALRPGAGPTLMDRWINAGFFHAASPAKDV